MAYILSLNQRPKVPRPNIGPFMWSQERRAYIAQGRVLHNADELADAVNAGLEFLQNFDNPFLVMRAIKVEDEPRTIQPHSTRRKTAELQSHE